MRCIECVTEPITPGHFCECCGRKLSLEERKGLETAATPVALVPVPVPEPPAPAAPAPVATRCESCGGPCDNGTLCATCQHVFQAFLDRTPPASDQPAAVAAEVAHAAQTPSDAAPEPQPSYVFEAVLTEAPGELAAAEAQTARGDAAAEAEAVRQEAIRQEAIRQEAIRQEAVRQEAARQEAAKAHAAPSKIAAVDTKRPVPKPPVPAAPSRGASVQPRRGTGSMVSAAAAAVVIVSATGLGLGAYWYKFQGLPFPGQGQPAATVAPVAEVAERVATPDPQAIAEAEAAVRKAALASERPAPAQAPAAPKAKTVVPPRAQPNSARQPVAPPRQVASATVTARPETPVHEPEPPSAPVSVAPAASASASASVSSVAPIRPFFEPKDVNEAPQIATRVEPQLPDDLRGRAVSDVVVVRLLVSQSGHPSSVSLLRRSKAGQSLDDAVVAAVQRWTFSPAKKKGEAVSCWLNVGVPVGRAN